MSFKIGNKVKVKKLPNGLENSRNISSWCENLTGSIIYISESEITYLVRFDSDSLLKINFSGYESKLHNGFDIAFDIPKECRYFRKEELIIIDPQLELF